MADAVVRAILEQSSLKVSVVVVTDVAREARRRHRMQSASASIFAQGLVGGALMASLQKGETRINLQLECDGPFRGFFVDAAANGDIRGYVKNPDVALELASGVFQWRAALGNTGFLSVLRDVGGEYYRSSTELVSMHFADDLNHYFKTSDQVATRVALSVQRVGDEPLGKVAGVLIQSLPEGDVQALERLGAGLAGAARPRRESADGGALPRRAGAHRDAGALRVHVQQGTRAEHPRVDGRARGAAHRRHHGQPRGVVSVLRHQARDHAARPVGDPRAAGAAPAQTLTVTASRRGP